MKKNYSFYSLLTALPLGLLILVSFSGGQGGAYSGSPGDSNANCTSCHAPGANHGGTPMLTGVPTDYTAGTTYNLTLSINGSSVSKFGFNITAEDQSGNKVGTWIAGTGSQLRNGGASDGLTHSVNTSPSWSFSWTAPMDVGPITFYYATNQANGASGNSGDYIVTGNSAAVLSIDAADSVTYEFYPTEVDQILNINLNQFDKGKLNVYDLNGNMIYDRLLVENNELNFSQLSSGIYIANISVNGITTTERFIKK